MNPLMNKDIVAINGFIRKVGRLKNLASKSYATMFIYKALDEAESKIGWGFAELAPRTKSMLKTKGTNNV